MATNRQLRADLLKRLGVTPQRLSQRVQKIKTNHGPMSTEDATYVIAHLEGMDLTKYLASKTVDRVRTLVPQATAGASAGKRKPAKAQVGNKRAVKIGGNSPAVDIPLTPTVLEDAKRMASLYPKYYILENSIRYVIIRMLQKSDGKDWWQKCVSKAVRDRVDQRRQKEADTPWHGKRGQHEIYYSDFGDLKTIIQNNWPQLKALFPSQTWILSKLDDLEHPRNVMAHHNPVSAPDEKRIGLHFDDWVALLKSRETVIP